MAERFLRHRLQEKLIIITQKKTGIAPVFLFNKYNFMVSFLLSQNPSVPPRSKNKSKAFIFRSLRRPVELRSHLVTQIHMKTKIIPKGLFLFS